MKIAISHLRHAHTGGTERHLNQVAAHLARLGHEVTIVCRSHESAPHPAVRFQELRSLALGATWRLASFARAVERHVAGADYDVVYGLGRTWSQDVLRLGGGSHETYLELAHAATRVGLKRWLSVYEPKHRFALRAERRALHAPRLRRIVVNARMVQRDIARRHALPDALFELIYNGVDLERFHPGRRATAGAALRAQLGISPAERVVLFLGTGYARKGLDLALHACAALPAGSARLLVAGYDSAQPVYESLAARLGLGGRAHFLGGRRDAEAVYAAADLYLLPTRYDPFANTTLEALAAGLPALTTTANGAHELIEPGVQGSVFTLADPAAAWTAEIARWLGAERLAAGSAAARRLAEAHSVDSKMAQTAALLTAVARERRGAVPA
ncbi:MAG: glycosyltransferase family 4 protein [Planctomycetes bacterium]|nr:glycosyltransferase family 4 protein [Planctomycetota bacterium]